MDVRWASFLSVSFPGGDLACDYKLNLDVGSNLNAAAHEWHEDWILNRSSSFLCKRVTEIKSKIVQSRTQHVAMMQHTHRMVFTASLTVWASGAQATLMSSFLKSEM